MPANRGGVRPACRAKRARRTPWSRRSPPRIGCDEAIGARAGRFDALARLSRLRAAPLDRTTCDGFRDRRTMRTSTAGWAERPTKRSDTAPSRRLSALKERLLRPAGFEDRMGGRGKDGACWHNASEPAVGAIVLRLPYARARNPAPLAESQNPAACLRLSRERPRARSPRRSDSHSVGVLSAFRSATSRIDRPVSAALPKGPDDPDAIAVRLCASLPRGRARPRANRRSKALTPRALEVTRRGVVGRPAERRAGSDPPASPPLPRHR